MMRKRQEYVFMDIFSHSPVALLFNGASSVTVHCSCSTIKLEDTRLGKILLERESFLLQQKLIFAITSDSEMTGASE